MSYSYSQSPYNYGYNYDYSNDYSQINQKKNLNSVWFGLGGLTAGAGVGAFIGVKKNPYINSDGAVKDSFAKAVNKEYLRELDSKADSELNQMNKLSKGLKKVKTKEDMKSLLETYKLAAENVFKGTAENYSSFVNNLDKKNLDESKKVIKNNLDAKLDLNYQTVKNKIKTFWDCKEKNFKAPESGEDAIFKVVDKIKKGVKTKQILLSTGIAGIGLGLLTFLGSCLITKDKNV